MDRRDFVTVGAVALTASSMRIDPAQAGQVVAAHMTAEQMDAHLRQLDQQLDRVTHSEDWFRRQVAAFRPADAPPLAADSAEVARCEALTKKILRGLLVLGSFRDLPEHGRVHPGMQARMLRGLEESSEAMAELTEHLRSYSPADRMDMEATLRRSPEALQRLAAEIDQGSVDIGVAAERRAVTRNMMTHLKRYLGRRPSSVIFDEYLEKVEAAVRRPEAQQRLMTLAVDKLGEAGFAAYQQRMQSLALTWANVPMANLAQGAAVAPGRDLVTDGAFRYKIVVDKIMVLQVVPGKDNQPGMESVVAVLTPPQLPRALSVVNGSLLVDSGESLTIYDIRDPFHPVLASAKPAAVPPILQSTDNETPNVSAPTPSSSNHTRRNLFIASGILMGVAAVFGLLCIIPQIWICMLTPLAIFFLAGLICLIIALAIRK